MTERGEIERLREVWRETRNPGLADTYELLARESQSAPLAGRTLTERAASWLARAEQRRGDPLELPILLSEPWTPEIDELERLRLLEPWSPDPLLAATLAGRLRVQYFPPSIPAAREIWLAIIALLDAQGDPRQLATFEWMLAFPGLTADLRVPTRRAHAQLAAIHPTPLALDSREHAARLAHRAALRRDQEFRSAELLAAVHAAPDCDEPRLVYADWLSAHGDPRGEFITLQIERALAGGPVSAREHELVSLHGPAWTGRLNGVLGHPWRLFERGFLSAASVEVPNLDGELVQFGEWSTLRTLDGHVSDALARRGPLEHLRELYGFLQLERFVALRADNRLAAVTHYECSLADPNLPLDIPLGLRALLVRRALDDVLLRLLDSSAIAGLEQFGVYYGSNDTVAADHRERRSARHRFELLCRRLPLHVRRLVLVDDRTARATRPWAWMLSFERDELDVFSRLRVDWGESSGSQRDGVVTQLVELLDTVGLGLLRRLELGRFDYPDRPHGIERLRELAGEAGCEFVSHDAARAQSAGRP
jgi:uncharacterized protein (TIGR02996 family)